MSPASTPTTLRAATPRALTRFVALLALAFAPLASVGTASAQDVPDPAAQDARAAGAPLPAPGTLVEVRSEGRLSPVEVQRRAAPVFGGYGPVVVENEVAAFRIRYVTTGLDGRPAEVTAQVFLPVRVMLEGMPLYVFGSGTTGIGDQCAPSRLDAHGKPVGEYPAYLMAYAGRGFATVLPNYLGFDDPDRPQAYFHAESEAHVMLDAVRAVRELVAGRQKGGALQGVPELSGAVFAGGYSQGGHAAFSAADMASEYAPDVRLNGIIGYGATTNVGRLFVDGPYYAPYVMVSYASVYGDAFDPARVLAPGWLPTLVDDTVSRCVDEVQQYYPFDARAIFRPAFVDALRTGTVAEVFPDVHEVLEENRTGLSGHGVPALVIQGSDDIIATNATQERFVAELCETGSPVMYVNVAGARHRHTKPAGFEPAVAWMKSLVEGVPPPTSCEGAPFEVAETP